GETVLRCHTWLPTHRLVTEVDTRSAVLVLLLVGLMPVISAGEPAKDEEKVKEEVAKLQGTWQAVRWVEDGENQPDEVLKYVRWTFKGNKLFTTKAFTVTEEGQTTVKGQGGTVETDYHLDLSKKHKVITGTTVKPAEGVKTTVIYELDGDTLKVCG